MRTVAKRRPDLTPHIASGDDVTEADHGFVLVRFAASRSKPLAKRAFHSAVPSERLASLPFSPIWVLVRRVLQNRNALIPESASTSLPEIVKEEAEKQTPDPVKWEREAPAR
jgi:hypothetical protein